MSEVTEEQILELIENIILLGHEHIISIHSDKEAVFKYMKEKQEPGLNGMVKLCRNHFEKMNPTDRPFFLNVMTQVAAYKGIVDMLLKDKEKNILLTRFLPQMNQAYTDLKGALRLYREKDVRFAA